MKKNLVGRLRARREIEVRKDVERRIAEAVAEEREVCAQITERYEYGRLPDNPYQIGALIAAAIRARSNPTKALDKGTGGGSDT